MTRILYLLCVFIHTLVINFNYVRVFVINIGGDDNMLAPRDESMTEAAMHDRPRCMTGELLIAWDSVLGVNLAIRHSRSSFSKLSMHFRWGGLKEIPYF